MFVFYFVDNAFADIGLYPEDAFKDAIKNYRDDPDMQGFIDNIQKTVSFLSSFFSGYECTLQSCVSLY